MKVLDLFSGIGGMSLGLERAGMETVAFCEIDEYCRKVLAKHWPAVPIFEDVRTLRAEHVGSVDLICGGYPCQPFSIAGQRFGEEDDRDLWPEMFRIIGEVRPAWMLAENTYGHVSLGLDRTLSDLERLGYAWEAFVIPACAVEAPHERSRVWIVAHTPRHEQGRQVERTKRERVGPSGQSKFMADGDGERCQKPQPFRQRRFGSNGRGEAPRRWPAESRICRVAHGIPNRVDRLRALGNAVVPQVVEQIGRAIMQATPEGMSDGR